MKIRKQIIFFLCFLLVGSLILIGWIYGSLYTAFNQPAYTDHLNRTRVEPTRSNHSNIDGHLQLIVDAGTFQVYAVSSNRPIAEDVANALQSNQEPLCSHLQIDCSFSVTVEIYPDQVSFDDAVMNPAYRGYYAISGRRKIQMVSPQVAIPGLDIPYSERVNIAVHEYVHLALDEIDPDLPAWIDEGTAIYMGPHAVYEYVCHYAFPFDRIPRFQDLIDSYTSVPAADLFAYTLVRFIAEEQGAETLNELLRSPDKRTNFTSQFPQMLESAWHTYLEKTCTGSGNGQ